VDGDVLGVVRWCVAVHTIAVFAQPAFAGRYMIGVPVGL